MSDELITELRSAASTLRTSTNGLLPNRYKATAELLEWAATALQQARHEPPNTIHSGADHGQPLLQAGGNYGRR